MATPKFDFFLQKSWKSKIWLLTKKWNHPSFVNISPTLVIDTSMESFARVPTTSCKPKNLIYFSKKVWNSKFYLWQRAEITLASSISVLHWLLIHQWKGLHEYYTIKTQKMWKFFKKFKIDKIEFCPYQGCGVELGVGVGGVSCFQLESESVFQNCWSRNICCNYRL